MKSIGLLGGMSWESTLEYYRTINLGIKENLGGLHSAKILIHSVDFAPIEKLLQRGEWESLAAIMIDCAASLERAGADFFLICTNTMHKLAPVIEENVNIPLLHIADATADALLANKIEKVGLLGTAFTMEEDFFKVKLREKYGMQVVIPEEKDRQKVNSIIFSELCCGRILESSKNEYIQIMNSLADKGAEAIILGCTEIGLLVQQEDTQVKIFDTTPLHAAKAIQLALEE